MTQRKKLQFVKSVIALLLTAVLIIGEGSAGGSIKAGIVQAEESGTKITSITYYNDANAGYHEASSASSATYGFVMPKFNGMPSSELSLADVQGDLTLYVKQEKGTNNQWIDIDEKTDYFQFNVTWGWESQDWGGWICWFKVEETTYLKFESKSNPNVNLEYTLQLNKLSTVPLTSITPKNPQITASPTGSSGIDRGNLIYNGNPSIQYSQVEKDFGNSNILVKRDSESEFVPLFDNAAAGWRYDYNFGVYEEGNGGWWFGNLSESITIRFHSNEGKFPDADIRIIYEEPVRTNYRLSATNGNEFDARREDHSAVIGLCLPRIGGTDVREKDLEKFVYQIKAGNDWKNLGDVWLYRENGYSSLSDRTQWGYSKNDLWELWFKPVKEDTEIRIGYPLNGETGGDIGDNYVYYKFIGDPKAYIPDISDMGQIDVDNTGSGGDVFDVYVPDGWTLIWNDEFNGNKLDDTKWWNQTGYFLDENDASTYGWGNKELEYYTDSSKNTSVHDGNLNLTLLKESKVFTDTHGNSVTAQYSSGKVLSQNKFAVKYGRVDFRAKLPGGAGIWPALWMMPNENTYGTWAKSGELDVMEGRGRVPDIAFGTLHYGNVWPDDKEDGLTMSFSEHGLSDMTNWHVYSVVWEEDNIKIYCDGICYYKGTNDTWWSAGAPENKNAPFDIQYYLIMNLAAGGYFDGLIAPEADVTRKDMYVDYVRVYQKAAENGEPDSDGDGLYGDYYSEAGSSSSPSVPLERMTLDKTSITIPAGVSEKITARFEPANATNKNVTWTSSNEKVATVSGGMVKGIAPGKATITAKAAGGKITQTCQVEVKGDDVQKIELNYHMLNLKEGNRARLTATVTTGLSNQNLTWTSSKPSVVTVDENGNIAAVKAGEAVITVQAEDDTHSDKCTVKVTAANVKVTGVTIMRSGGESGEITLEKSSVVTLTASVTPDNASDKSVRWESSDTNVATVDEDGKVTGIDAGFAKITVTTNDGEKTDSRFVIVKDKVTGGSSTEPPTSSSEYGIEKRGDAVVFYLKTDEPDNANIADIPAFYNIIDEEGNNLTNNNGARDSHIVNGYRECIVATDDLNENEDNYLIYWFSRTVNDQRRIKISDIPSADDGENPGDNDTETVSVKDVLLNKESLTMQIGDTAWLEALVLPYNATNRTVNWTSSNRDIVEVDNSGKLNAKKAGEATITVKTQEGNYEAECIVTVQAQCNVTFKDKDDNTVLKIQSVAKGGTVTRPADPQKKGYIFVRWVDGDGNPYDFDSVVQNDLDIFAEWSPIKVTRIQISENITLEEGKTTSITSIVRPGDALNTKVEWKSDSPDIAEVNEKGLITAKKIGEAIITATAKDGSGVVSNSCTVKVTSKTYVKALYTVDFVVNGKTISNQQVWEGDKVTKPENPKLAGYNFIGWYDGDKEYDFNNPVAKRTILNAKFVPNSNAEKEENDKAAAANVDKMIEDIGNNVTLDSQSAIEAARKAYDNLTSDQKALVKNLDKLESAETTLAQLIENAKNNTTNNTTNKDNNGDNADTQNATVKLNATSIPLQKGKTTTALKVKKKNPANDKVEKWESSNTKIVTVTKAGKIKAKTIGTAKVTVTMKSGATATCKVKVQKGKVTTKKLTASSKKATIKVKGKVQLEVERNPITATEKITWSTSNKKVATVTNKGKVTGKKKGKATITAKTTNGKKIQFKVTVK